jgi:hypothetical protein
MELLNELVYFEDWRQFLCGDNVCWNCRSFTFSLSVPLKEGRAPGTSRHYYRLFKDRGEWLKDITLRDSQEALDIRREKIPWQVFILFWWPEATPDCFFLQFTYWRDSRPSCYSVFNYPVSETNYWNFQSTEKTSLNKHVLRMGNIRISV